MAVTAEWTAQDFIGGALCLDFVNTRGGWRKEREIERLSGYSDLLGWARFAGLIAQAEFDALVRQAEQVPAAAEIELCRVKHLREAIHGVFSAAAKKLPPMPETIETLRTATIEAIAASSFDRSDGWVVELPAGGLRTVEWRVVLAAFRLGDQVEGLAIKECGRCAFLFIDRSKNRRRLWCDGATCGNRVRAERHYHRREARAP